MEENEQGSLVEWKVLGGEEGVTKRRKEGSKKAERQRKEARRTFEKKLEGKRNTRREEEEEEEEVGLNNVRQREVVREGVDKRLYINECTNEGREKERD
ncbi:hypothetical protein Pmani_028398 [Petrolisthes manimaculis]|uniref:Uncharacterized protein n=1 Tax=Petrolisthes manimaculis TaxID=1843537 RepID=A0AAE1P1R3_9EUCA|nr:hypothetical protein Pmani_028398 [Petrolisthes manimaculis]